jgi:hypothetical protein
MIKIAGIGHTDFISQLAYEITNLIYYIFTITFMFTFGDGLKRFAKASATMGRKFKTEEGLVTCGNNKLIQKTFERRIIIICLFQMAGICCLSYFWYLINTSVLAQNNLDTAYEGVIQIIVSFLWVPFSALTLMPVPVLCLEGGMSAILEFLAKAFEQWKEKFECNFEVSKKLNQIVPVKTAFQPSTATLGN